jgi:hypothetical protein
MEPLLLDPHQRGNRLPPVCIPLSPIHICSGIFMEILSDVGVRWNGYRA